MYVNLQSVFSKLLSKGGVEILITLSFVVFSTTIALGQCENPTVDLPDASYPVDGNINNAYCVTLTFDPAITGIPLGISMGLTHTFQGDLSIAVIAGGNVLNVVQRPGTSNCSGGCDCGDSSNLGGGYVFVDGGTDPDGGMAGGGGIYGVTANDPCGIGTVSSFADLWAPIAGGGVISAAICITDHAFSDSGTASDISFIFPNPVICGCTDPAALNYNPAASVDDGSCLYDCEELNLTVAQDYFEFCAGNTTFDLSANAPIHFSGPFTGVTPTYEWTATGSGEDYIIDRFSAYTLVMIPDDFEGSITFTVEVTFTVDDGDVFFSCDESTEVEVVVGPPPEVEITGPTIGCEGDLVELQVVGGPYQSILWLESLYTGESIFVSPGIYSVMVEDVFGCTNIAEYEVEEIPMPIPTIEGPEQICFDGGQGVLAVDGNYDSYLWSTQESSSSIDINMEGYYSLTVTDINNCQGFADFFVESTPQIILEIMGDNQICEGEETVLSVTDSYDSYVWSTGDLEPYTTVSTGGLYSVIVTDINDCQVETEFEVGLIPSPTPVIVGPEELCLYGDAELSLTENYTETVWDGGDFSSTYTVYGPGDYSVVVTNNNGCVGEATFIIDEGFGGGVEIIGPEELCPGISGELSVEGEYRAIEWSTTGGALSVDTILGPGDYSVIVIDLDGCVAEDYFYVDEATAAPIEILGPSEICANTVHELSTSGTFSSFSWSSDSTVTASVISITAPGEYTVTATDADGCLALDVFNVSLLPDLEPEITGTLSVCPGETTILSTENSFASYTWQGDEVGNSEQLTVGSGTYSVLVTDANGCVGTDEVEVTEFIAPTPTIQGDLVLCEDEVSSLSTLQNYVEYIWNTEETTASIDINQDGGYSVTVTDINGCTGETSVSAEAITVSVAISGDTEICEGESSTFSVPEGFMSYEWSTNDTTAEITANSTQNISVLVTDANGCTATDNVDLLVNPLPEVAIAGNLTYCPTGATELTATDGYVSYLWSTAAATQSIEINEEMSYGVTVTDANACENSTSVFVIEEENFPITVNGADFCEDLSTEISVEGLYVAYNWSNNSTEPTISVNQMDLEQSNTYSVTVTDEFGCQGIDEVTVEALALPEPVIAGELEYCAGLSTSLSVGSFVNYTWNVSNVDTSAVEITTPGMVSLTVVDENGCIGSTTAQVIENALPVHSIQGVPSFCPEESTVLSGEEGFVIYNWSTNSSATTIVADAEQSYELSVTDANGCVGVASIDVAEYVTAIPEIVGERQFCPEGSTDLNISNSFEQYNWSTGSTASSINILDIGAVTVLVTDINGCETENSTDLSYYEVLAPEITSDAGFCAGFSADLVATPGYQTYNWSNSGTTSTITVAEGGVYELDVIDQNGCVSEAVTSIEQYDLPTPAIGGSLTFCTGLNTSLNAGADYALYSWSTGDTTSSITINQQGLIALTVTDEHGCVGDTSSVVAEASELSPVISGDLDYCAGLSTELSAGDGFVVYEWTGASGVTSITVTEPGIYTLYVEDAGGCSGSAEVEVIENPLPTPEINGFLAYCEGLQTELSSSQAYQNYNWNTGSPADHITVNEQGTYGLTVTDANSCVNSVSVDITEQASPVYAIVGPEEFCINETTELSIEPAYTSYEWSIGDTTQSITVGTSGIVAVTVTDEFGCQANQNISLSTVPLPIADAGLPQTIDCNFTEVSLGGDANPGAGFSYQWSGPGINGAMATTLHPVVNTEGDYTLLVINDEFGCMSEAANVLVVDAIFEPQIILEVVDVISCVTDEVQIDARNSDTGQSYVYQWFDGNLNLIQGANSLTYNATIAQYYSLRVLDMITGCDNMDGIEVEENIGYPFAEAGEPQLLTCNDTNVDLNGMASQTGGQIAYIWTTPDGGFASSPESNIVSVNSPGLYYLEVVDILNGCANMDSVFVSQDIVAPVAATSENFELNCLEPNTIVSGQGSSVGNIYAYQWLLNQSPIEGATQLQFEVGNPGLYQFQVMNIENGCITTETVNITLNPSAPQALNYVTDRPTCAGDKDGSILLAGVEGGTSPFLFSIDGAPFTDASIYTDLSAGVYDIALEDAIGCILHTQIEVVDGNDLRLDLGDDLYLGEGEFFDIIPKTLSVDSAQLVNINWQTVANLECKECIYHFDLQLSESTQFFLSIKDVNGCTAEDNITVYIDKDRPIYVPSAFSPNDDGNNDIFYIFAGDIDIKINSFLIFNRWGEAVFEVYDSDPNNPNTGWDGKYRGSTVNAAIYVWFAEIEYANGDVEIIKGDVTVMH